MSSNAPVPAPGCFAELPVHVSLAETSTTQDVSGVHRFGSFGDVSALSPLAIVVGPEGAVEGGDGD